MYTRYIDASLFKPEVSVCQLHECRAAAGEQQRAWPCLGLECFALADGQVAVATP